jgi:hypothetical protein
MCSSLPIEGAILISVKFIAAILPAYAQPDAGYENAVHPDGSAALNCFMRFPSNAAAFFCFFGAAPRGYFPVRPQEMNAAGIK